MKIDVVIVGGGASGLMAAITCQKQGKRVLILEQKDKIGKKILATGNGKCNFTNLHQDDDCYRSEQAGFYRPTLNKFGVEETKEFFEELGVLVKDRNGYLYPYSGQASTILDALRFEVERLGVQVACGARVKKVVKKGEQFEITYSETYQEKGSERRNSAETVISTKQVILSAGGKASPAQGSDGSGYELAKMLGHHVTNLCPSLTGLKAKESYCKALTGVRTDATVSLFVEEEYVMKDTGELQLTSYGISGIPVFQICRHAGMALLQKKDVVVKVDFFPTWKEKKMRELVFQCKHRFEKNTAEEALAGFLNKKVLLVLLKQAEISCNVCFGKIPDDKLMKLCKLMKGFEFHITDTNGFENAQVCAGGIDTREVNPDTLESKIVKGLYFAGELLDVDGICGGYNLQWAWSSGYVAGLHAGKTGKK